MMTEKTDIGSEDYNPLSCVSAVGNEVVVEGLADAQPETQSKINSALKRLYTADKFKLRDHAKFSSTATPVCSGVAMGKNYDQLYIDERYEIYRLHQADTSLQEIGRLMGRAASTISRELRRMT